MVRDVRHVLPAITDRIFPSSTTITTTATLIPTTALSGRKSIAITNESAQTVYLGNSNVTTADGYPVARRDMLCVEVSDSVQIYGIVAAATSDVRTLEVK